ncbi:putative transmembrane protein [Rhizoctonia solani 123E]|uniref:Putative transmembrane protein n=1 Tax=Rhizoctonia solani 123E TaxID=1423351 RepID=A0A074S9L6_9AGAM|nr:putative transmembrane protein [Rhizoctonia solani 123E]
MGKCAYAAEQRSLVERPVASTVPVAFTAFLVLLVQSLSLVPNGSIEGIQRIVSIIWLASALQTDQVVPESAARSLDKLQKVHVMDPISPIIPPDASEGCLPNIQCLSLLNEGYISQAEQRIDQVSQVCVRLIWCSSASAKWM